MTQDSSSDFDVIQPRSGPAAAEVTTEEQRRMEFTQRNRREMVIRVNRHERIALMRGFAREQAHVKM